MNVKLLTVGDNTIHSGIMSRRINEHKWLQPSTLTPLTDNNIRSAFHKSAQLTAHSLGHPVSELRPPSLALYSFTADLNDFIIDLR